MYSIALVALLMAGIGYLIGTFITNNKSSVLKEEISTLKSDYEGLNNDYKKEKKQINRLNQQAMNWKQKFEKAEAEFIPTNKRLKVELESLSETLREQKGGLDKLKVEHERLLNQQERLKGEHERLKERYATDLSDSKGWKNKRESLNREIKDLTTRLNRAMQERDEVKSRLEKQSVQIKEAASIKSNFRKLEAQNKKLQKELEYWEKKHYDTHHELAQLKIDHETLIGEKEELIQLGKGSEILQDGMKKKIEEFKTKFVNVNNQYHELLGKK